MQSFLSLAVTGEKSHGDYCTPLGLSVSLPLCVYVCISRWVGGSSEISSI